jgi:DNA-binding NarL/FixJ family response regulator
VSLQAEQGLPACCSDDGLAAPGQAVDVAVEVEVRAKHGGDVPARDAVSLATAPGEVFGLLGHYGVGKSTTVRILTGRAKPTSGRARVLGHEVTGHLEAVRGQITPVEEQPKVDERGSAKGEGPPPRPAFSQLNAEEPRRAVAADAGARRRGTVRRVGDCAPVSSERPRVVVVHRLPAYRRGLAVGLGEASFDVVQAPAADKIESVAWDACLIEFPATGGPSGLAELRSGHPDAALVALISSPSATHYRAAFGMGMQGAVHDEAELTDIALAIRAALEDRVWIPIDVMIALAVSSSTRPAGVELSTSAIRWLQRLSNGASVARIAHEEGYSERQMYRLMQEVYVELGVKTRGEALVRAARWGITDTSAAPGRRA